MSSQAERAAEFLFREAALLDHGDLDGWVGLLTDDIEYKVPVRSTRYGRPEDEFSRTSFHFNEDLFSLSKRAERLKSAFAWAEDPPTRTRHFISNVYVVDRDGDEQIRVRSNLMLVRTRFDDARSEVLTGERTDILRGGEESLRLARRTVHLDQTTLPAGSISTFL
ncbi:aromatic-ring-hydroxylating dioxygenase subunit beta [Spirillospora sp. NPDC048819]|uniref:aromatic-ring-hydroxylating dioxygenase subunit beta n=1 Tax=Spirillospora sp. NPDC048819 TaxID=3155268 RepID=UPI0033DEF4F9